MYVFCNFKDTSSLLYSNKYNVFYIEMAILYIEKKTFFCIEMTIYKNVLCKALGTEWCNYYKS